MLHERRGQQRSQVASGCPQADNDEGRFPVTEALCEPESQPFEVLGILVEALEAGRNPDDVLAQRRGE